MVEPEKRQEQQPIDQVVKEFLLAPYIKEPWAEDLINAISLHINGRLPTPQENPPNYKRYFPLSKMTPEEIKQLSFKDLAINLYLLDIEDLDYITDHLPSEREDDFWNLVQKGNDHPRRTGISLC